MSELEDRIELVDAASEFAVSECRARVARERVVRLARRLVNDPLLTDEEAIRKAGEGSVKAVLDAAEKRGEACPTEWPERSSSSS